MQGNDRSMHSSFSWSSQVWVCLYWSSAPSLTTFFLHFFLFLPTSFQPSLLLFTLSVSSRQSEREVRRDLAVYHMVSRAGGCGSAWPLSLSRQTHIWEPLCRRSFLATLIHIPTFSSLIYRSFCSSGVVTMG